MRLSVIAGAVLLALAFISPARAQSLCNTTQGAGGGVSCGETGFYAGGPYVGVCDLLMPTIYWGMRACGAAQLNGTTKSVQMRRASDNATQDIVLLPNGNFDLASAASFIGGSSGFGAKMYAQVGTTACGGADCAIAQGTAAMQPTYIAACVGTLSSKPCLQSRSSASSFLISANSITPSNGTVSMMAVFSRKNATGASLIIRENGNNNLVQTSVPGFLFGKGGGGAGVVAGQFSEGKMHVVVSVVNGASSFVMVDGVVTTGTMTGNTTAGTPILAQGQTATNMQIAEGVIWDGTALTQDQAGMISWNALNYWNR